MAITGLLCFHGSVEIIVQKVPAVAAAMLSLRTTHSAAALVPPTLPAAGTNCHRSCYTLDLAKALPLKQSCEWDRGRRDGGRQVAVTCGISRRRDAA